MHEYNFFDERLDADHFDQLEKGDDNKTLIENIQDKNFIFM